MSKNLVVGVVVVIVVIAGVVTVLALAGRSNKPGNNSMPNMNMSNSQQQTGTAKPVATNSVTIQGFAFSPASITVKVGTTVTWTNRDSAAHTVTADTASSDAPSSGDIATGKSYSFTFQKAGTYTYHCTIHPYMKGTVTVTE